MFCSNCGTSAASQQVFCASCGHRLNAQSQATSASINQISQPRVDLDESNAPKPMRFIETIKFSYKNYARFSGRASRSEYWYWVLFIWLGFIVSAISMGLSSFFVLLYLIFIFSVIIPGIARAVRRLHDINKSGAFLFMGLIPFVGSILLLVWFCTKSDSNPNQYGPAMQDGFTSKRLGVNEPDAPKSQFRSQDIESNGNRTKAKSLLLKNKSLVIITTLVVVFLGVLQSHVQYGKLIGAIEVSELQMHEYNDKIGESWDANTSGTPRQYNSDESKVSFGSDFMYLSGLYEPRIRNAGKNVRGIVLLPWNMQIKTDRSNYVAHNMVWQKSLESGKSDAFSDPYGKDIDSTWANFCREIKNGIPWYTFGRFDTRVAKICISDSDDDSTN
jgi:uncharacterized membrane protein YhaH (DUF805 family)